MLQMATHQFPDSLAARRAPPYLTSIRPNNSANNSATLSQLFSLHTQLRFFPPSVTKLSTNYLKMFVRNYRIHT